MSAQRLLELVGSPFEEPIGDLIPARVDPVYATEGLIVRCEPCELLPCLSIAGEQAVVRYGRCAGDEVGVLAGHRSVAVRKVFVDQFPNPSLIRLIAPDDEVRSSILTSQRCPAEPLFTWFRHSLRRDGE